MTRLRATSCLASWTQAEGLSKGSLEPCLLLYTHPQLKAHFPSSSIDNRQLSMFSAFCNTAADSENECMVKLLQIEVRALKATPGRMCPIYLSVRTGIKPKETRAFHFLSFSNKSWIYLEGQGEGYWISIWHGLKRRKLFVAGPEYDGNLD